MPGEKTEAPTPKRREEARRRGQVARSQELSAVVVLLGGLMLLRFAGAGMVNGLTGLMTGAFLNLGTEEFTAAGIMGGGSDVMLRVIQILLPFLLGVAVLSIAGNVLQTGPVLSGKPLRPQWSRINPGKGAKRIVGKDGMATFARNLLRMSLVGGVIVWVVRARFPEFSALGNVSAEAGSTRFAAIAFEVLFAGAAMMLVIALLDLLWQRRRFQQQLRMSKQDVRDELKRSEGDPGIRGRMRQLRRDLFNRMISQVPSATVVVTNPTEIAVALRYDPLSDEAPVVVAKGQRLMAQRIREIAREHDIPLWEDRPLAQALYRHSPIGQPIPAHLYQAMAEILAFLFRLRAGLMTGACPRRTQTCRCRRKR